MSKSRDGCAEKVGFATLPDNLPLSEKTTKQKKT
jgi:hypothetical protein